MVLCEFEDFDHLQGVLDDFVGDDAVEVDGEIEGAEYVGAFEMLESFELGPAADYAEFECSGGAFGAASGCGRSGYWWG